jgi:hypothetical protein
MKRSFYVAGVQFRPRSDINEALRNLIVGDKLCLSVEPTNRFDPNAVQIIAKHQLMDHEVDGSFSEVFLGYVPKKFSSEVSAMLGIGAPIICTVDEVNPDGKTYEMIKVTVEIPVDEDTSEEEDNGEEEGPE